MAGLTDNKESLNILVIDDHMLMRKLVSDQLRSIGYRNIDSAINGQDALTKLQRELEAGNEFNIVVLDRGMPVMSGMELLRICRSDQRFDHVAFVMLTGEREQECVMEALKAGATSYIVKPVSKDQLESKIDRVVEWISQRRGHGKMDQHYV